MNKDSLAYHRKHSEIATRLILNYHPYHRLSALEEADEILAIPGILIATDDQSLPSFRNAVNKSYNDYMLGQEDMLKARFRKVELEVRDGS